MATIAESLSKLNTDLLNAYDAIEEKGGEIAEDKNSENLAPYIRTIPTGTGADYGTVGIQDADGNVTQVKLDLSGFLGLSPSTSDGKTITINGITYNKSQVVSYDTGDTLNVLLPSMFNGAYWDSEAEEEKSYFSNLKTIRLGDNIKETPQNFISGPVPLETLTMTAVERIGRQFISSNNKFNAPIVFPDTLVEIGDYFLQSAQIFNQPITFPSSLTTIGDGFMSYSRAFSQDLTIPANVTSVGSSFMSDTENFSHLIVEATTDILPPDRGMVLSTWNQNYKMFTEGIEITGAGADIWKEALPNQVAGPYRNIIGNPMPDPYMRIYTSDDPENPQQIYQEWTARMYVIGNNNYPSNTIKIEFCQPMQDVDFAGAAIRWSNLQSTLEYVEGMQHLKNVVFGMFSGFSFFDKLKSIGSLPLTQDGRYSTLVTQCPMFNDDIVYPEGATYINGCVSNCLAFNSTITLPSTLVTLDPASAIVNHCPAFNQPIVIPEGVAQVGTLVMYCETFNSPITLPSTLTALGTDEQETCFVAMCGSFNQPVNIPIHVTSIYHGFLRLCGAFDSPITLPNGLLTIGNAFLEANSSAQTSFNQPLTIPSTVTTIGANMLYAQRTFNQDLVFPESLATIQPRLLAYCGDMSHTITFLSPQNPFVEHPSNMDCTLAGYAGSASYTQGISIAGPAAEDILSMFPNGRIEITSAFSLWRNLRAA